MGTATIYLCSGKNENQRRDYQEINPGNRRGYHNIIVGTGRDLSVNKNMSIVNDALKKAEQEGQSKSQPSLPLLKKEAVPATRYRLKNILSLIGITTGLIIVSLILYNLFPRRTNVHEPPSFAKIIPAKTTASTIELNLSGIAFGREKSWAVINDRIVREGDTILGAKLLKIEPNFVELAIADDKLILDLK